MNLEIQGWDGVADDIQSRLTELNAEVAQGFARVDHQVVTQFRDEQLSGRKGDDTGLNIRTGTLHDSIQSVVEVADNRISGTVYNVGATYWEYHQTGAGHNPKRLFFDEYFETEGLAAYTEVVENALQLVAA